MPKSFNFDSPPFDSLTPAERQRVRDAVDIGYFRKGDVVLEVNQAPDHLLILIKGFVQQMEGDEVVAVYGKDDYFDVRSLFAGGSSSRYVVAEEMLAYLLPKAVVKELVSHNASFGAMLFSDISQKLNALAEREGTREMQSLMMARVDQAFVRQPVYVDGTTDVASVIRLLREQRISNALVRVDGQVGIFTTTDLQTAALTGKDLATLAVGDFATFKLIGIQRDAFVFDALVVMIRHGLRRVVVRDGESILGVLEQLDLLSFLSNHSHLISLQVEQAKTIEQLKSASSQIQRLFSILHSGGVKVELIARLAQELNRKVFSRVWSFIAPKLLQDNSCLIVMGSEGRGEQVLRTDQDNGLILRNGFSMDGLEAITERFNDVLKEFGYPECTGNVMVRNPVWRQSIGAFRDTLQKWVQAPDGDAMMNLAIFIDAVPIAGDATLLDEARQYLGDLLTDNAAFFSYFARMINAFEESGRWWSKMLHLRDTDDEQLDIKKLGTFPIVHGIRALSLEHRIGVVSTQERIEALMQHGALTDEMGSGLLDALHFFMGLKLKTGLSALTMKREPSNRLRLEELSTLERDILKDSLDRVKRFKVLLRHHFKLDAF